jgi:hypothetical protein
LILGNNITVKGTQLEKGATLRDHYATDSTSFSAIYLTGSTANDSRDPTKHGKIRIEGEYHKL